MRLKQIGMRVTESEAKNIRLNLEALGFSSVAEFVRATLSHEKPRLSRPDNFLLNSLKNIGRAIHAELLELNTGRKSVSEIDLTQTFFELEEFSKNLEGFFTHLQKKNLLGEINRQRSNLRQLKRHGLDVRFAEETLEVIHGYFYP